MTRARDLADSADKDIAGTITLDAVNASGVITGLTVEATGDTAAGDNAAMGYTAAEGLILTGQGSSGDITIKNDADAVVLQVPTGTTNVNVIGSIDVATNAVIDGTALVTGVLTTTAATVFNGGFAAGGVGSFADGSAGAPSITNTGDLDTGIYFPAAGKVGIVSQGTESIRFSTSGDIFIQDVGNLQTLTSGTSNLRIGANAGEAILSSGNYNTLIGDEAGTAITIGDSNVAIGYKALFTEDAHGENVAVGVGALQRQDAGTNAYNNAFGNGAGTNITDGLKNVFVGHNSGAFATTSDNSVFVGYAAGQGITGTKLTGNNNIAIGYAAGLLLQGTATNNLLIGEGAGAAITVGEQNTIIGGIAGDAIVDTDANTLVGYNCGGATTGTFNAFYGRSSGSAMTSGTKNSIIGSYNGNQDGLDIRTASNYIVLSDGDGVPKYYNTHQGRNVWNTTAGSYAAAFQHSGSGGYGVFSELSHATHNYYFGGYNGSAYNFIVLGNGDVQNTNNQYGATSDVKLKENITDAASQWEDIKALTVRKYSMKTDNLDAANQLGVIAQEVEAAGMGGLVNTIPDVDRDGEDLGTETKAVKYSILYMKAVKALQEAMTRIETLETKVAALEG